MEIRIDPRLRSLPKVEKKKDQDQQQGSAFEEALRDHEGTQGATAEATAPGTGSDPRRQIHKKPRNGDGKGLKVDLLA